MKRKESGKEIGLPKISVVIPAANEEKNLTKVLKSLKKQDYRGQFEIIVANNGSTDKTAEVAEKFGARVVFEARKGAAFARQAGFQAASGEIVASTDADCLLPENWLSRFAEEFRSRPDAIMVSGMYDFYDGSRLLRLATHLLNYRLFAIFGWYSGANMAVKKDAFFKLGGFNTSIPLSEDSDLGVRLRKLGKVVRIADFKVKTSGRRFNQQGFVGGVWDYSTNYIKFKLNIRTERVSFKPGSEVSNARLGKILTYAFGIGIFFSAFLMVPVSPAHARAKSVTRKFGYSIKTTMGKSRRFVAKETSKATREVTEFLPYGNH